MSFHSFYFRPFILFISFMSFISRFIPVIHFIHVIHFKLINCIRATHSMPSPFGSHSIAISCPLHFVSWHVIRSFLPSFIPFSFLPSLPPSLPSCLHSFIRPLSFVRSFIFTRFRESSVQRLPYRPLISHVGFFFFRKLPPWHSSNFLVLSQNVLKCTPVRLRNWRNLWPFGRPSDAPLLKLTFTIGLGALW